MFADRAFTISRGCWPIIFNAVAFLHQTNVRLKSGGYGNLILSRWPLAGKHQISLRLGRRRPRGAQMVLVDTPEGSFTWSIGTWAWPNGSGIGR